MLQLESDGKAIFDRTVLKDDIVGLPSTLAGGRYSLTAVTLEESELAFVESLSVIELMKRESDVSLEVLQALGEEVTRMRDIVASTPRRRPSLDEAIRY